MSITHEFDITVDQMSDLVSLADGVLPLQRWIAGKAYNPRIDPTFEGRPMPWRDGGPPLTVASTGFAVFFEALIRETSADGEAMARWGRIASSPLSFSPRPDPTGWRDQRGLSSPAFGIVRSQNVLIDSRGNQTSRAKFYADTLPDLAYCIATSRPDDPAAWEEFAEALFRDQVPSWIGTVYPSSVFMNQFCEDVLYCVLGMRNWAPDDQAYATGVLTELGQARRRGNMNTRAEAADAVDRFVAQIVQDERSVAAGGMAS